ncbi:EAL domain-containing protein [Actinoplanes sp. NPDC023801]|uniref:EAL domain-containing protein n=1 Tax=Actinoplanes sp. NPDC023801 TaxID=3154595 RepID=UPI003410DA23
MDLDDILALADTRQPSPLELARARRVGRAAQAAYDRSRADGYEILADTDLIDPLTADIDEAARVERAAQRAKRGTITWTAGSGKTTGVVDLIAGRLKWSDEMAMIFGYAPGTLNLTADALVKLIHPADRVAVRTAVGTVWAQRRPGEITFRTVHPGGAVRHVHCHIEVLTTAGEPSGLIATGRDVTILEIARQERRRLTTRNAMLCADQRARDLVTGLPNRGYLTDEVDRARRITHGAVIVVATQPASRLSAATGERDHEELTSDVAALLREAVGPELTCGLIAPGLWGVLMTGQHAESAHAIAVRAVSALRRHLFTVRQKALRLDAWAGVARFAGGVHDTGFDLFADAEHAAREARRQGLAVHALDQPADGTDRENRCRSQVLQAVATDGFALYAQPIVDLALNQIARHEILLRVRGSNGDFIAPWAFLDMAERVGEILAVDKWVIDHALELIGQGAQTSHYQINISGKSLADPGLLAHVTEAIHRHRVKPECLTFEITETALIENRNEALAFATGIRDIGCQLALDDFGTGHAALAYLKYLPVDLVKIDGVFVVDICQSPPDQAIVSTLVELCHTLGIRVAAECVQDDATVTLLREYGVDFAQGYRMGRPAPIVAGLKNDKNSIELELRFPESHSAMG